jgi:hypothetical protein
VSCFQLGYMPHRDDFEDFDRETENLVAQVSILSNSISAEKVFGQKMNKISSKM